MLNLIVHGPDSHTQQTKCLFSLFMLLKNLPKIRELNHCW